MSELTNQQLRVTGTFERSDSDPSHHLISHTIYRFVYHRWTVASASGLRERFDMYVLLLNVLPAQILLSDMLLGRVSVFKDCIRQFLGTHTIMSPRLMLLLLT